MKNLLQSLSNMHAEFGVAITDDSKGARNVSYASLVHTLDQIAKMTKPHGLQLAQDLEILDGMPIIVSTLTHLESGEVKTSRSILTPKPEGDVLQNWGGATTYHKRYGAMTVCGLFCHGDPTDSDGQTSGGGIPVSSDKSSPSGSTTTISTAQAKWLYGTLKRANRDDDIKKINEQYGRFESLTPDQFRTIKKAYGLE